MKRWFSPDHVWIDARGRAGVTEELVLGLEEVVRLHLPPPGAAVRVAESMGALEGEKGLVDIFAPASGLVLERNDSVELVELRRTPRSVWLVRLEASVGRLLSEDEYDAAKRSLSRVHPRR